MHNFSILEVLNDTRSSKQFDRLLRISRIPHKIRLTNFFINESEFLRYGDVRSKSLFARKIPKNYVSYLYPKLIYIFKYKYMQTCTLNYLVYSRIPRSKRNLAYRFECSGLVKMSETLFSVSM